MEILEWIPGIFNPHVKGFLMAVGVMHLSIPPFVAFVKTFTKATPSKKDDEYADLVFSSKVWNLFVKLVTYLSAIRLPEKKK